MKLRLGLACCLLALGWVLGVQASPLAPVAAQTPQPSTLPWVQTLLAQPDQTPAFAQAVLHEAQFSAQDPEGLVRAWQALSRWAGLPSQEVGRKAPWLTANSSDPLHRALTRLAQASGSAALVAPLPRDVPEPLRSALAQQIEAIVWARGQLDKALKEVHANWPPQLHTDPAAMTAWRAVLLRQALQGDFRTNDPVDIRQWLGRVDRQALAEGMGALLQAAVHLQRTLVQKTWPEWVWQQQTPWGLLRLDTTRRSGRYWVPDPLLWVSLGGDDHYRFGPRGAHNPISVFMDMRGHDEYVSEHDGADPSVGFLGLGLLWDGAGRNQYTGTWLAQGAGFMGAGVLVDGSAGQKTTPGSRMEATGHAQGFALEGLGLLWAGAADDTLIALTHAQGSAGPGGAAWLINAGGNDRYELANTRLVQASSQLPQRNASMGQGAGRGWRGRGGAPDVPGGMGLLVDLAGNDHYTAQVFAQGVGFQQGLGLLIDAGGNNRHEAAWYALGAAAHQAVGVFWASGQGDDVYTMSHSSGLGAATDRSLGWFEDVGGDDRLAVVPFSQGQAAEGSVARCKTRAQGAGSVACSR